MYGRRYLALSCCVCSYYGKENLMSSDKLFIKWKQNGEDNRQRIILEEVTAIEEIMSVKRSSIIFEYMKFFMKFFLDV